MKCELCKKEFKRLCDLSLHLTKEHKTFSKQDYYDTYLKTPGEGVCLTCGKPLKFLGLRGYAGIYCSRKCADKSPFKKALFSKTWHENNTPEGVSKKVKQTKLHKYGDANYNNRDKTRATCLEKYGVDNVGKSEKIKQQIKQTKKERYGDENYNNIEQIKQTQIELYGNYSFMDTDKVRKTMLEKYGVENIMQLPEYRDIVSQKNKENASRRMYKTKQTCYEKYGVPWVTESEEIKNKIKTTNFQRYGKEYVFQVDGVKEKIKESNLNKYGVEYYTQSLDFHKKKLSRYFYDGFIFDSSYELCFYKYCIDHNIQISRSDTFFEYEYNGKIHKYFPDFKVVNKYIEIKGEHFFEDGRMINPFDRNQDELYEAKHQCMLENNVDIVTDCEKYVNYITSIQPDFLDLCSLNRNLSLDNLIRKSLGDEKQDYINIVKKPNDNSFYNTEIELWNNSDKQFKAALFKNMLKDTNKNPNELTDLEIILGLNGLGYSEDYTEDDRNLPSLGGEEEFLMSDEKFTSEFENEKVEIDEII